MANRVREPDYYAKAMALCRSRREEIGLTQNAVAERLGVSHDTYWRWERGNATLTDGQLKKLLKILESTPEELDAVLCASGGSEIPSAQATATTTVQTDRPMGPSDASEEPSCDKLALRDVGLRQEEEQTTIGYACSLDRGASSPKRGQPRLALAFAVIVTTGCILAGVKGTWLRSPSPPQTQTIVPLTADRAEAGQGATRPGLFQACYESNKASLGQALGVSLPTPASPQGNTGECQRFVKGGIYLSDHNDKAYAVTGNMARAHERTGGIAGPHALGFPTSDVGAAAASRVRGLTPGTYQRFERGSVYESSYGAYPVVGAMNREHERLNGTDGKMGFPTGMPHYREGKIIQDFEGGRFTVDDLN